jgi:hypothetical protein
VSEETLSILKEERKAWLEWMHTKTKAIRAETKAMQDKRMEANMNDGRKESMACQVAMEANPEEKEAVVERQDISNEVATVMPVRGLRKQCTIQKLAAEHRQNPKGPKSIADHKEE